MKTVKQSFTLVEILVVIVIIGILSSFIFFTINDSVEKANIAKSKMFSESIRNNLLLNLVGEWKLNGDSGTNTIDSWGNMASGTLTNFAFDSTDGWEDVSNCVNETCIKLDGVNDYVDLGIGDFSNSFFSVTPNTKISVSAWINTTDATTYTSTCSSSQASRAIIYNKTLTDEHRNAWGFHVDNGKLRFTVWEIGSTALCDVVDGNISVNDGKWHNVVLVYSDNGNNAKLYVDGVLDVDESANYRAVREDRLNDIHIGGRVLDTSDGNGSNFNGKIDEVLIYNSIMSETAIKQIYLLGIINLYAKGLITESEYNQKLSEI
jgi:prepilin-type N-terminal cleavage/methylation domain-containing protein